MECIEQKLKWNSIDKLIYTSKSNGFVFSLSKQSIGVYSMGRAYVLRVRKEDETTSSVIASFWVSKDGGYDTYIERSVSGKIWESIEEIIPMAEELLTLNFYLH